MIKFEIKEEYKEESEERQSKKTTNPNELGDLGDSVLYCIGGIISHFEPIIHRWDSYPQPSISYLSGSLRAPHWETIEWPRPRLFAGTVVHDHKLFLFGGNHTNVDKPGYVMNNQAYLNEQAYSDTVDIFDLRAKSWYGSHQLRWKVSRLGVCSLNEHIYISGGLLENVNGVEKIGLLRLCPISGNIEERQRPSVERCQPMLLPLNGYIYALSGGEGDSFSMERYDPNTDQWSSVMPRRDGEILTSATVHCGKIYTLHYSGLEVYCPVAETWTRLADSPVPGSYGPLASINDRLVSVGDRFRPRIGPEPIIPPSREIYEFDLETSTWIRRADMNSSREDFFVQVYNPNSSSYQSINC